MTTIPKTPMVRVKLDWRAYFKEFDAVHGWNPIHYKGRLLWPDGWQYSSTDYRGPEWAPSDAEKMALALAYWTRRRTIVFSELRELKDRQKALSEIQANRSAQVQQVVRYYDQESGKWVRTARPVDMAALQSRIDWLAQDLEQCDTELGAFNGEAQRHA